MKKNLVLIIFVYAFVIGKSQGLVNTEWFGTNPPSINLYFRFGVDTLYYSTNGSVYNPLSLYTTVGTQFSIFDLPGATLCTDTGHYNYSTAGGVLSFTLINDNCSSRRNTLLNYYWTLLNAAIAEPQSSQILFAYPNPSIDGLVNFRTPDFIYGNNEMTISDITGKTVFKGTLIKQETCIDLSFLQHGVYVVNYRSKILNTTFRIIR